MTVLLFILFGVYMGLYCDNVVSFLLFIIMILIGFSLRKKAPKYLIILSILFSLLGFCMAKYELHKYKELDEIEIIDGNGIVVDFEKSTDYKNVYLVKDDKFKYLLYTPKSINLRSGQVIHFEGEFSLPDEARNEYGFNYREYLRQRKIAGSIKSQKLEIIGNSWNPIYKIIGLKYRFRKFLNKHFDNEAYGFINGVILADDTNIDDDVKELFEDASLLHVLAVSGMHINIIENILKNIFDKCKIHKKISQIVIINILVLYMIMIGSPVSCIRAVLMELLECIAFLFNKRPNFKNNIIISLVIICLLNPYNILNSGMWLSYMGTIGIVYGSKFFDKKVMKLLKRKNKLTIFISENISISISVQLFILPIIIYYFNNVSMSCLISNLFITPFIAPIVYLIIISIIIHFFEPINILISILYKEINLIAKLDFFSIYVARPPSILIVLYYVLLFFIIFKLKNDFIKNYRFFNKHKTKFLMILIIIVLIYNSCFLIPKNYLEYDFIDVGQGDCSLIITPKHRCILIDGGNNSDYDNGEKTILPILINKHIKQIDYLIISHFDSDHVGGLFSVIEKYKVKRVVISRQGENSDNFEKIMKTIKSKKIEIILVNRGNRINVEKNINMDIFWPDENNTIIENCLNNNSIVCKLNYGKTSILFTGDIEEEAENRIIKNCKETLNSTIIKVPHHGSKSSSTEEFLYITSPKIALIGVGKNNKFGHPNEEIVERYENMRNEGVSHRSDG